MKGRITISLLLTLLLAGCGSGNKQPADDLITVDVTANYPKRELILQDFMDVEYIPLETTDEFLVKGRVMDVSENLIAVANTKEGDILLFDRITGKTFKKINHKGQGPEEYVLIYSLLLNEDKNEMFVSDPLSSKIQVYDFDGNYKRSISYNKMIIFVFYHYNEEHFLCEEICVPGNEGSAKTFFLLSKQDGSMKEIKIPYEKRKSVVIAKQEGGMSLTSSPQNGFIVPYQNSWVLTEPSADTVYLYQPDHSIRPLITRIPSVQTMTPEVFLFPGVFTDRYYFMQTVKKEYDFEKEEGFPTTDLMYDKQKKKMYQITLLNNDYAGRKENMFLRNLSNKITFHATLDVSELMEANKKGKLNGKLKEITSKLDEESNPVIMLVKNKK